MNDWERFGRYARRVRALHLDEQDAKTLVSREAFDEVSRSRVSLNVLPNLRQLMWVTTSVERMRLSLMFQNENITDFTVYVHRTTSYPISTFFKEVMLRMPRLKQLDLRFTFAAHEVEDDLAELFCGLPRLKKIVMPLYTLTSGVVEKLSTLKELEVLQFEFRESQGRGDITDVLHFDPQLQSGAFPALADASLSVVLPDMTRFLTGTFSPAHLTSLYLHTLSPSAPDDVHAFLTAVAEHCHLLARLFLDFFTSSDIRSDPSLPAITWSTLRPLLACAHLIEFEVRWDKPFDLAQSDVEDAAAHWPGLEVLMLNCEPMHVSGRPCLDLRALLPFARHCPRLAELGLYIDGDAPFDVASLGVVKPFASLARLCVGNSPVSASGDAALWLSELCPLGCEVVAGVTWPAGFAVRDDGVEEGALQALNEAAGAWFEAWREVNRTLPLLTRLRREERERRCEMEKELEGLRARCRVLEGQVQAQAVGKKAQEEDGCVVV